MNYFDHSVLSIFIALTALISGYLGTIRREATSARERIKNILQNQTAIGEIDEQAVLVQMLRRMNTSLPTSAFGGLLFVVPIATVAYGMYVISSTYGYVVLISGGAMWMTGVSLGTPVWKNRAKKAFVVEYNRLLGEQQSTDKIPWKSPKLLIDLILIQSKICGTMDEIPLRHTTLGEDIDRKLREMLMCDDDF